MACDGPAHEGSSVRPGDESRSDPIPTSEFLLSLPRRGEGEKVTLGELVDSAGTRAYGFALLLFALPEALPLPVVGLTAIVALPVGLLGAYMAVMGTERPLPGWLRRRSIKRSLLQAAVAKAAPMFERIERITRPRWQRLAEAGRPLGLMCLVLAAVVALPIPFGNMPPALCIVGIAFGMVQRDGRIVAGGLAAACLTLLGMAVLLFVTGRALLDFAALHL